MSLNNVTLLGRICSEIENRTTTSGKSVATFRIAVDRSYTKQGEQKQADFITIVAWEGAATFVSRYFTKGSMIAIQGRIQTRSYEDNKGNKRTAFEVVATDISFCGGKSETSPGQNQTPTTAAPADFEEIGNDDDLPF